VEVALNNNAFTLSHKTNSNRIKRVKLAQVAVVIKHLNKSNTYAQML